MSSDPFRNYDAWLEKPYQHESFDAYWEKYNVLVQAAISHSVFRDVPESDLDGVQDMLLPVIDAITAEIQARWAANCEGSNVPTFEDWLDT